LELTGQARRPSRLERGILFRLYLMTMPRQSMHWLNVRRWLVDRLLGRKHQRLQIFPDVFIEGFERLTLGDNVSLNRGCHISAAGGLTIGNDVSIAHATSILTAEHRFEDPSTPIKEQPVSFHPVSIGNNIWIGAKVCILGGVTLADGTIVAAGAVVKHSVLEENCTIGGVPARVIKRRGLVDQRR